MEIRIDLDLPSIIGVAVSAERVQPLVDKAISEAIKDAINEATGYRSAFRDELKKQLAEAMPKGLSVGDCAKFQLVLNAAVTDAVQSENAQTIQAALRAAAKAVMPDVPERIKLSELMEAARDGLHKDKSEAFYAHLEVKDSGYGWLSFDRDENCKGQHRADIRMSFNKEGAIYSLHLSGRDITPKSVPDAIGRFEGLLLSMYVGRTSLEVDIDEDDVRALADAEFD